MSVSSDHYPVCGSFLFLLFCLWSSHAITTSGLSTFGLWCLCVWEDSSTSGQPGGPLPFLWSLVQWGVCFHGQRPGARMKAAALNSSVLQNQMEKRRERCYWQNRMGDQSAWISIACRQRCELQEVWALCFILDIKSTSRWGTPFSSFFFSLFFHFHPPSFKGSSLLTVLSLFPQYQNIWSHQAGFRLWCWHFLMPTSREHLISVNEQIKGTVAWSN